MDRPSFTGRERNLVARTLSGSEAPTGYNLDTPALFPISGLLSNTLIRNSSRQRYCRIP